jgi:hypothetical protein
MSIVLNVLASENSLNNFLFKRNYFRISIYSSCSSLFCFVFLLILLF